MKREIRRTAPGAPYSGDHSEYLRAVARMIRGAGRRAAEGDPAELAELMELRAHLDDAIALAVVGQRSRFSLSAIASELGVSRVAVSKMHASARERLAPLTP